MIANFFRVLNKSLGLLHLAAPLQADSFKDVRQAVQSHAARGRSQEEWKVKNWKSRIVPNRKELEERPVCPGLQLTAGHHLKIWLSSKKLILVFQFRNFSLNTMKTANFRLWISVSFEELWVRALLGFECPDSAGSSAQSVFAVDFMQR